MTPEELWLYIDAKRPEIRRGNMRESELSDIYEQLMQNEDYL